MAFAADYRASGLVQFVLEDLVCVLAHQVTQTVALGFAIVHEFALVHVRFTGH